MHSLEKNQQRLQYATYSDQIIIYERDEAGNIIYNEIDGECFPRIIAERAGYNNPVFFMPIFRRRRVRLIPKYSECHWTIPRRFLLAT